MLFRSTIQTGTLLRVGTQIIHHEVKETFETKAGKHTKYVGLYCAVYTCFGVFILNIFGGSKKKNSLAEQKRQTRNFTIFSVILLYRQI